MNWKTAVVLFLSASILNAQELPVYWSKGLIGPQMHVGHVLRRAFVIFGVGYSLRGYYAHCGLSNQTSNPVRVVGARDEAGEFRAKATLSVSTTQEGPWRKVTHLVPAGRQTALVVRPHSDSQAVIVRLNELARLVDKFDYAKISLPTGEATIFPTKELKH